MRIIATITSIGSCVAVMLTAAGCGGTSTLGEDPAPPAVRAEQGQSVPDPTVAAPAGEQPQQWAMPNLVGTVLQDAQDEVQALTGGAVYFTDSHDLGGQDRNQVLDANWQVCTQNIAAGAALTSASQIDLGVVKLDEACP